MSDPRPAEVLEFLAARSFAMGDIVARLLAYEAKRAADPMDVLREFSEMGDERLLPAPTHTAIRLQLAEAIRRETDWLIDAARKMVALPGRNDDA
jgi:hypothetical protein